MKKIVVCLAMSLIAACGGASDVDLVKSGTMSGYETTSIGNAFDASFDSPAWEAFQGSKGERVVQFTGRISKKLHDTAADFFMAEFGGMEILKEGVEVPYMFRASVPTIIANAVGVETAETLFLDAKAKTEHFGPAADMEKLKYACKTFLDNHFWEIGTPVEVQWIVTPDGSSYNLTHMGSVAWQGVNFDVILKLIYQ